jgi:hypothetical protein
MVCLRNICVDTLQKGDTENNNNNSLNDDDNNNNNKNKNGKNMALVVTDSKISRVLTSKT